MGVDELLKANRKEIPRLASKHGARNVRIFGSVAWSAAGPESDVDILVQMEEDRSLLDHVGLMQDLEDLLGKKVDIVTESGSHWYIRDQVMAEAVSL
jgi:predicted nucleotidyltransferase